MPPNRVIKRTTPTCLGPNAIHGTKKWSPREWHGSYLAGSREGVRVSGQLDLPRLV